MLQPNQLAATLKDTTLLKYGCGGAYEMLGRWNEAQESRKGHRLPADNPLAFRDAVHVRSDCESGEAISCM